MKRVLPYNNYNIKNTTREKLIIRDFEQKENSQFRQQ